MGWVVGALLTVRDSWRREGKGKLHGAARLSLQSPMAHFSMNPHLLEESCHLLDGSDRTFRTQEAAQT